MGFTNPAAVNVSGNFGPWTAFTPVISSTGVAPTMLAANRVGWITRLGQLAVVHMRFAWTAIGAGEALGTGNYRFILPVNASGNYIGFDIVGAGSYFDLSSGRPPYLGHALIEGATNTVDLYLEGGQVCSPVLPVVPANGDFYAFDLMYETV